MRKTALLVTSLLLGVGAVPATAAASPPPASLAGSPPYRRLFLDAMVVEQSHGLERVFHALKRYSGNPILVKDRPYEGWGPYLYGTVLRDGDRLRMWYQVVGSEDAAVLYAESRDGIHWRKPDLGLFEAEGSRANNIVARPPASIASVILDSDAKNREDAWQMFAFGGPDGAFSVRSNDGIHWDWGERAARSHLFPTSDVVNVFWDPYQNLDVATYKTSTRRHRAVGLAVSDDGLHWTKPVPGAMFTADDLDPDDTQVYGMPVFPYEGLYIGMPWIYHARYIKHGAYSADRMTEAQEGSPRTVDVQLSWSWDLTNWTRTRDRAAFLPLGPAGAFDSGMVFTARAPVRMRDELWFYYGGFDRVHDDTKGVHGAIGLATLRLDGFCSMQAGAAQGWLISRREAFDRPTVHINARTAPGGYVTAELLDRNNHVLPGFSRADCIPFTGDAVDHRLRWRTEAFPKSLDGRDKKIRFILQDADLYSYLPEGLTPEVDSTR
jgi:hypothetical protein